MAHTDESLLKTFAEGGDEAAFRRLAERYLGLVFSTALRRTGNRQLAEEVSQNVLCALAKKAAALSKTPDRLPAWLHRATLYESSKAMRSESSHRRRSQLQHPDRMESTAPDEAPFADAIGHLDVALDRLSPQDREMVFLRYFEERTFASIAESRGRTVAAVQKQCQRALQKLSRLLRSKGVALSTAVIATGLTAEFAKSAPVHLLKEATVAAGAAGGTSTLGLTLITIMKSKFAAPVLFLFCCSLLAFQRVAISKVERHNLALREQLAGRGDLEENPRRPLSALVPRGEGEAPRLEALAPLVSSPETVRSYANTPQFDDWAEMFSPTPGKPWQGGKIKPSDLEIESKVDHLSVTALSKLFIDNQHYATLDDPWKPRPPVVVHASRETQRVTLPDGKSLAIEAIFTAYPTGSARSDWMSGLFDPLTLAPFQPVPGKEIPMIKPSRENHFYPQKEFPEMAFIVSGDLTHMLDFRLFDTKTHQPMKKVMGKGMGGNVFYLPLRQWHSSAFRCVIDFASGPIEEGEIGFRTGSTASFSDFDLEVVAIEKLNHPVIGHEWLVINRPQLIPSFSDSAKASQPVGQPTGPPKRRYTWTLDPTKTADGTLVAFSLSNVQWLPPSIEIEAFSDSGTLTKVTASCDGNLVFVLLPAPPEQLRSLQIRYPSTWVRAIFEFGEIPGLPRGNYDLVNLFDVHVPYSKSNYRPETFISSCTKLRIGDLHRASSGPISFEYEDTTVQEITEEFRTDAGIFELRVVDGQRLEGRRSP